MLPSVAILTVRVANVGIVGEFGHSAHRSGAGQLSTGPQHWNPTSDTSLIWTKSVALRLGEVCQEKWIPGQSKEPQSQQFG